MFNLKFTYKPSIPVILKIGDIQRFTFNIFNNEDSIVTIHKIKDAIPVGCKLLYLGLGKPIGRDIYLNKELQPKEFFTFYIDIEATEQGEYPYVPTLIYEINQEKYYLPSQKNSILIQKISTKIEETIEPIKIQENQKKPQIKKCEKILEELFFVHSKTKIKNTYIIGEDKLVVSATIGIKPPYDYDSIIEMLGNECSGQIMITKIENAVPKGFKIDPQHTKYDEKENTLYWEESWTPNAPNGTFDLKTLTPIQIKYILHPQYIVHARTFNPKIVIEIIREGKPVATAKFKLFEKETYVTTIKPKNKTIVQTNETTHIKMEHPEITKNHKKPNTVFLAIEKTQNKTYRFTCIPYPPSSIIPTEETTIPEDVFNTIKNMLEKELNSEIPGKHANKKTLEAWGKIIYNIIPDTIKNTITEIKPKHLAIIVDKNTANEPWEIIHNGEEFLTTKIILTKHLKEPKPPNTKPRTIKNLKILVIASHIDLPEDTIKNEIEHIKNTCKQNTQVKTIEIYPQYKIKINNTIKTLENPKQLLTYILTQISQENYGLIHIAGHGKTLTNPLQSYIKIKESENPQEQLTVETIKKLLKLNETTIIFINICQGGKLEYLGEKSLGIAKAFLDAGAGACITPTFKIDTNLAAKMAKEFYTKELAKGQITIGEALTKAKKKLSQEKDIAWISYTLYGNPHIKIT